jgi:TM2 domain-containing membrane protein YozV
MFAAWRVRHADVEAREEALREQLRSLTDEQRRNFYRLYRPRLRDPDTYAVLNWFFVGGLHHFYLGDIAAGLFNLLVMLTGVGLLLVTPLIGAGVPPFAPLAGVGLIVLVVVIELPALFRSQAVVAERNVRRGEETLRELGLG